MGVAANLYRLRRIFARAGAADQLEFYWEPEKLFDPRPCYCEWSHLCDHLLGRPERPGHACACAGPVPFNVPGYAGPWGEGDEHQMRQFCELQEVS